MESLNNEIKEKRGISIQNFFYIIVFTIMLSYTIGYTSRTPTQQNKTKQELKVSDKEKVTNQTTKTNETKFIQTKEQNVFKYCLYDVTYDNIYFITSSRDEKFVVDKLYELSDKDANIILINKKQQKNETIRSSFNDGGYPGKP